MPYKDREAQLSAQQRNYQNNKEKFAARQREARRRTKEYLDEIRSVGCQKCDEDHIATIDFHHRDPSEKEVTASKMIQNKWTKERIDREVAKCDILCSNCHRKLHWELAQEE